MARAHTGVEQQWLLLIHSIPPQPAYFRAKVGKRLARIGAVAIKNSVYVLPGVDDAREDFQWIAREIVREGGEATMCDARFIEGMQNEHIEALFRAAREADYVALAEDAREAQHAHGAKKLKDDERRVVAEAELARVKKRLAEILAIDYFGAPGREAAEAAVTTLAKRLERAPEAAQARAKFSRAEYTSRTWVTRKNVHVDRIASAWLIQRFIDPKASFVFVPSGYKAKAHEVTFDMFEGTFTHVGERCTFEVLLETFALKDAGLRALAEIVHDIDVKDGKFARAEAPGFASLIAAIALTRRADEDRIRFGGEILDALVELYRRKRTAREDT